MYTTPLNVVLFIFTGAAGGVIGAMLGTGGGVFLIPLLVLAFGVPMHYAVATSIVSVIAASCATAATNVERGTANMRLGITLEIATALGAIIGSAIAGWLAASVLEGVFALMLLPTAALMWRYKQRPANVAEQSSRIEPADFSPAAQEATGPLGGGYYDESEGKFVVYRVRRLGAGLLLSLAAGSAAGMLGIGGGVFKVPALNMLCGVPFKAAAATSNFMIGVTAAAGAFLYYGRGEVRPVLTAAIVIGVFFGSALGTALNHRVRGARLRKAFAMLLVVLALQMLYRVCWAG